jgi:hypothetical protein
MGYEAAIFAALDNDLDVHFRGRNRIEQRKDGREESSDE